MRIIFMGSSAFAVPSLLALVNCEMCEIISVYTKTAKPAGRKSKITPTPIQSLCELMNIQLENADSLKTVDSIKKISEVQPELIVLVSYGVLLPKEVLQIPKYGCVNIHPSLLPRWRGASPIEHAILHGDKKTGVALMYMSQGLDEGDLIYIQEEDILEEWNSEDLSNKLAQIGANFPIRFIRDILNYGVQSYPQSGDVTYCSKIEDRRINFDCNASTVNNFIRAMYPKAYCFLGNKRLIIEKAIVVSDTLISKSGNFEDSFNGICCKVGVILPIRVKLEGKKSLDWQEFLKGLRGIKPEFY